MSFLTSMPSAAKASRNILFCMLGAQAAMTKGRLALRKSARKRSPSSSQSWGWIIPNSTGNSMRARLMKSQMSIFSNPGHLPVHTHMIRPGRCCLLSVASSSSDVVGHHSSTSLALFFTAGICPPRSWLPSPGSVQSDPTSHDFLPSMVGPPVLHSRGKKPIGFRPGLGRLLCHDAAPPFSKGPASVVESLAVGAARPKYLDPNICSTSLPLPRLSRAHMLPCP